MARYEFKFVVSDIELSEEHEKKVGQAVAQAGALALSAVVPPKAVAVEYGRNLWWYGIPPPELFEQLEAVAAKKAEAPRAGGIAAH